MDIKNGEGQQNTMARVSIESCAFSDLRFDALAFYADMADPDHARGVMLRIWNHCTEKETDVLKSKEVDFVYVKSKQKKAETESAYLFSAALVESGLAEYADDDKNTIRIKGCSGRTDWLKKKRESGRVGGSKSTRKGVRNSKGSVQVSKTEKKVSEDVKKVSKSNPLTLTLTNNNIMSEAEASDCPSPSKQKKQPSLKALQAASYLHSQISCKQPNSALASNFSEAKRTSWAKQFDLLNRSDKQAWPKIQETIDWLFRTENMFVVLSGSSFRKKFDAIRVAMGRSQGFAPNAPKARPQGRRIPTLAERARIAQSKPNPRLKTVELVVAKGNE